MPRIEVRAASRGSSSSARACSRQAGQSGGYFLLPRALGRLHREHPELELHYEIANSSRIEQQILRNELDLGFVGGP
jgi:DNA-binding transcriptional LysR family regulator